MTPSNVSNKSYRGHTMQGREAWRDDVILPGPYECRHRNRLDCGLKVLRVRLPKVAFPLMVLGPIQQLRQKCAQPGMDSKDTWRSWHRLPLEHPSDANLSMSTKPYLSTTTLPPPPRGVFSTQHVARNSFGDSLCICIMSWAHQSPLMVKTGSLFGGGSELLRGWPHGLVK